MNGELAEVLSRQYPGLQHLIALLREEQALLMLGQVDGTALTQLAKAKQESLTQLASLEQIRQALHQDMGLADQPDASEQAAREQGCLEEWYKVQALSLQASHLNRLNGTLIQQRLQHNQQVLQGLRQLTDTSVYSADGLTRPLPSLQTRA